MKIEILDEKPIGERHWYLAKGNLLDYLQGLKEDFYDFAIQRRIVKNIYLDTLFETVKSGDPIPIITLTVKNRIKIVNQNKIQLNEEDIEILDGLQRTYRLWAYFVVCTKFLRNRKIDPKELTAELKKENEKLFETGVLSTKKIIDLFDSKDIEKINQYFANYYVYFVVWDGLTDKDIISKMLLLNAGQKSVTKTHQYELLFLHYLNKLRETKVKVQLIRERDANSYKIKRGNRECGQLIFSSVIVALQSFVNRKPLRVETESLIHEYFEENEEENRNPFVRSALFNLKKKDEKKRDDQSDKKEDVATDDEFAEFDVPAFLRDR